MVSIDDLLRTGPNPLCSDITERLGVPPVGSAICTARFILIDAPDPWPFEGRDHPVLEASREHLSQSFFNRSRVLLSRNQAESLPRVQVFQRETTGCSYFTQSFETEQELSEIIRQLPEVTEFTPLEANTYFVCVHGQRDVCCGTKGRDFANSVKAAGYTVEEVSHIGGHRYSPTVISLPDGHGWAHADLDLIHRIESEPIVPTDVEKYRGWWGAKAGAAQQCVRLLQMQGISESEIISIENNGADIEIRTANKQFMFSSERTGKEPIPQCEVEAGGKLKFRPLFKVKLLEQN